MAALDSETPRRRVTPAGSSGRTVSAGVFVGVVQWLVPGWEPTPQEAMVVQVLGMSLLAGLGNVARNVVAEKPQKLRYIRWFLEPLGFSF